MTPIFQEMPMGENILSPYKSKKLDENNSPLHPFFKVQRYLQAIIDSSLGFKKMSV